MGHHLDIQVYFTPEGHIIIQLSGDVYGTLVCRDAEKFRLAAAMLCATVQRGGSQNDPSSDIPQVFRDAFNKTN